MLCITRPPQRPPAVHPTAHRRSRRRYAAYPAFTTLQVIIREIYIDRPRHKIIYVGGHVTCEISPYDLSKGRITFRKR